MTLDADWCDDCLLSKVVPQLIIDPMSIVHGLKLWNVCSCMLVSFLAFW